MRKCTRNRMCNHCSVNQFLLLEMCCYCSSGSVCMSVLMILCSMALGSTHEHPTRKTFMIMKLWNLGSGFIVILLLPQIGADSEYDFRVLMKAPSRMSQLRNKNEKTCQECLPPDSESCFSCVLFTLCVPHKF